jgi:SUKH-3 immunity protein
MDTLNKTTHRPRFDIFVEETLMKAGWFPQRRVEADVVKWKTQIKKSDDKDMFSHAEKILYEFGCLKIEQGEFGVNYPRTTFEINPSLAIYESDRFAEYEELLKMNLYPLGEAVGGYYFIAVGENGQVFWLMDNIVLIGENFDEAISNMILGIRPKTI